MEKHTTEGLRDCQKFLYFRTNFKISAYTNGNPIYVVKIGRDEIPPVTGNHILVYECPKCPKIFHNLSTDLFSHVAHEHGLAFYLQMRYSGLPGLRTKCQKCNWHFESLQAIAKHSQARCQIFQALYQANPNPCPEFMKVFTCPFCGIEKDTRIAILRHISHKHSEFILPFRLRKSEILPLKCDPCGWFFPDQAAIIEHRRTVGACQRNLAEKQKYIYEISGMTPRGTIESPFGPPGGGRESQQSSLSFSSDQNDSAYHTPITSLSEQPLFQYSPQPKKMIPFNHPVAIQCNQQQIQQNQMQQNQMQQNQMQATNQQFPIQFHQNQQHQQQMFPMQPTGQIQSATMQQNSMQATGMQMQQSSQQNVMHYQHIVQIQQQKKIPINIQVSSQVSFGSQSCFQVMFPT